MAMTIIPARCDHDHDHDHNPKPKLLWALIAAPMLLGFVFPTQSLGVSMINNGLQVSPTQNVELTNSAPDTAKQTSTGTTTTTTAPTQTPTQTGTTDTKKESQPALGSAAASSYGVDMTKVPRAKGGQPGDQPIPGKEMNMSDMMMDIALKPEWYYNNRFKFVGFVYRPDGWPADKMIIARFLISHCSADATPIGMSSTAKTQPSLKMIRG